MKWTWMAAACLTAAATAWGQGAAEKVATVDAARVLKEFYKTAIADERMDGQMKELNAERQKMLDEHDRLKKEFESARAEAQRKDLVEKDRNDRKDAAEEKLLQMMEYENKIRETALARRKQLEEQKFAMHKRLVEEIGETVRAQAEKAECSLVLDSSGMSVSGFRGVLYSASNLDLTASVIEALNRDRPADAPAPSRREDAGGEMPAPARKPFLME